MKANCLMTVLGAVALGAAAAELPRGDCARPAARTDLSACNLSGAKLAGKDLRGARFGVVDVGLKRRVVDTRIEVAQVPGDLLGPGEGGLFSVHGWLL